VDWQFSSAVPIERVARLRAWRDFEHVVRSLLESPIEGFWWEPFRSPRLHGCNRASFTLKVEPTTYDAFFNSPKGYRAQYAMSPRAGEAANRRLLDALEPLLIHAATAQNSVPPSLVLKSLRCVDAKVWIDELEVEYQLSDANPAIAYDAWEFDSLDGQGLRAPVGTRLEVKGGWLDARGDERRDSLKASRSVQIFRTGYS
jgi:hypothetical protein